ncbi:TIR domain-containing protein [Marinobacter sp. 1Y8]
MALFTEGEIRNRAQREMRRSQNVYKSQAKVLDESASAFNKYKTYDIFLSHSSKDSELILGMKGVLEDHGYSVYVDWFDDPQLDRNNVTKKTASALRERMKCCKSLFFVTTKNSESSKWMPWECGYFDGLKEKVAIVPVKASSYSDEFSGQEYLGLYPYCLKANTTNGASKLWIHRDENYYVLYDSWVKTIDSEIEWKKTG